MPASEAITPGSDDPHGGAEGLSGQKPPVVQPNCPTDTLSAHGLREKREKREKGGRCP